jgi:uncharacterized protein (TIGR01777 family)
VRVAITGSSGLIGSAVARSLRDEAHEVVPIVRGEGSGVRWDPEGGTIDAAGLEGLDAVVHLAGAGIGDHRWTDAHKRAVHDSRTKGTTLLAGALASLDNPPRALLSGSAIGYYGDRGDEILTEDSPSGDDWLASVCRDWEASTSAAEAAGIRVVHLRTGIVQSGEGGALRKALPLFKLGLGGRFGTGRQWWAWIAIEDEVGAIRFLLDSDVAGPVNLTAPEPVTNAEYTKVLGRVLGRPTVLPVPSFGPKLLLGSEGAEAVLHASQRVVPEVLLGAGFRFRHPTLEPALRATLGR